MNKNIKLLTRAALMLAIVAVLSKVSFLFGFSPVPYTLQTAGVIMAGIILGSKGGAFCMTGYALLGLMGLPIFAQGGGIGILLGPTGGFIFGFIPAAFIIGMAKNKTPVSACIFSAAGIVVSYITGVIQFSLVTSGGIESALSLAALPYLPGEVIKIAVFVPLSLKISKLLS